MQSQRGRRKAGLQEGLKPEHRDRRRHRRGSRLYSSILLLTLLLLLSLPSQRSLFMLSSSSLCKFSFLSAIFSWSYYFLLRCLSCHSLSVSPCSSPLSVHRSILLPLYRCQIPSFHLSVFFPIVPLSGPRVSLFLSQTM